jgi:predicted ABC-type ATPase
MECWRLFSDDAKQTDPARRLKRIAARVRQGGHPVPKADVERRFTRSWLNFDTVYRPLADAWAVYENSGVKPMLLEQSA